MQNYQRRGTIYHADEANVRVQLVSFITDFKREK